MAVAPGDPPYLSCLNRNRRVTAGFFRLRYIVVVLLIFGGVRWWQHSHPYHSQVAESSGGSIDCPLPPQVTSGDEPLQTDVPRDLKPFVLKAATLEPLAGFSVDARVLSREDYSADAESALSRTDLALGWKRMTEDKVLSQLKISQSSRWYYYEWSDQPPLPPAEIATSSANMHMIASSDAVAKALAGIGKNDRVRVDGWLVEATTPKGWRWRSSTTRSDTGANSCELIYVCAVRRL